MTHPTAVLLDSDHRWLAFDEPLEVLTASTTSRVRPLLRQAEAAAADGAWVVSVLAYEAAPAFDPSLETHAADMQGPPLAWFGVFDPPRRLPGIAPSESPLDLDWQPSISRRRYLSALERIHEHIAAGDTYQVNFTFALESLFRYDPWQLFAAMVQAQGGHHGAFVDLGSHAVCSATPELFFQLQGQRLISRPMKGTSRRGLYPGADRIQQELLRSEKNRAENLMIVDMIRNDFGRVADPGSIVVERLFAAETYPTVHQLTSQVAGHTKASLDEIMTALFPCASITGAPKISTSRIIRQLEAGPRGIYTGAIGYLAPRGEARFDVAIRTAVVDRQRGVARYGTGGGIVWDSEPAAEYEECRSKALVLTARRPAFELFETLLWQRGRGYFLLAGHLDRLQASAKYFGFAWDLQQIRTALETYARRQTRLSVQSRCAVRLRLSRQGEVTVETGPALTEGRVTWRIALDDRPIDTQDVFFYHKTSQRQAYDRALQRHPRADDVLLWNPQGELTETTRANLLVRLQDRWLTPPVESGLLAGVFRQRLLQRGRIEEQPLSLDLLQRADELLLVNSVRGFIRASLLPTVAESRAYAAAEDSGQSNLSPS